jgi:argininosuccinate lyase
LVSRVQSGAKNPTADIVCGSAGQGGYPSRSVIPAPCSAEILKESEYMRGRIDVGLSDRYKELSYPRLIQNYKRMFEEMMFVNKAHSIMLYDAGINDMETTREILSAVNDVQKNLTVDKLSEEDGDDLYFCVERQIISRAGHISGGKMHIGRSRNDLYAALSRMTARKRLWDTFDLIIEMKEILISTAKHHTDSVMTGYTHMQPAQPTTLAHYLTSYINVLTRDFQRIMQAYIVTNQNPLGAAAFAGTGFPVNRSQTATLLGFDGIVTNTWDADSSRDFILQAEAAYAILQNTLSRFAQDIYIWCTEEFGLWELSGEISGQSSIMPQKKNPSSLEVIKSDSGSGIGAFVSSSAALQNSPFSCIRETSRLDIDFENLHKDMVYTLKMMNESLKCSVFRKEHALRVSKKNFCVVTGLADYLVRKYKISFRDAHHITGGVVSDTKKAGLDTSGINASAIRKWSSEILGEELPVTDKEIIRELDPAENVESKLVIGGPARIRVEEMIADAEKTLDEEKRWLSDAMRKVADAYADIEKIINRIMGDG